MILIVMTVTSYTVYYLTTTYDYSGTNFIDFFGLVINNDNNTVLIARITFALFVIFYISTWIAVFFAATITREIQKQSVEIEYRTMYDPVTGLSNRKYFLDTLSQEIRSAYKKNRSFTTLLIDINHFTEMNDTLGHETGDRILREFGNRLKTCSENLGIPARISADEFAVILFCSSISPEVVNFSESLTQSMKEPFRINDQVIMIDFHVGAAAFPEDGIDPETLMKNTEVAIHTAKETKNRLIFYSSDKDHFNPRRLKLLSDIRECVSKNELRLYLQPKIRINDMSVIGAEALCRWEHTELGYIMPNEFIPISEKTGMMHPITMWMIEHTARLIGKLDNAGKNMKFAINLSAMDLNRETLVENVDELLVRYDVKPENIIFEVTESSIMEDQENSINVLNKLREKGFYIAIDDYGTGYSSLSYLQKLPVTEIKIDKSFILNLNEQPKSRMLTKSTIDLGHNLGLQVTAEGVEFFDHIRLLQLYNCDYVQGFYFSKPFEADEFADWHRKYSQTAANTNSSTNK